MTDKTKKICPLMTIAIDGEIGKTDPKFIGYCIEERCAWWADSSQCAITTIAWAETLALDWFEDALGEQNEQ
jgi:hypothetical protein